MARPRSSKYKGLPPNLVYDKTNKVYKYRRPDTGKRTVVGKDRMKAVSAAKQLNTLLMPGQDFVAKVMGTTQTLAQFVNERFIKQILPERKLSSKTLQDYKHKLKHILKELGELPTDEITVKNVADFLGKFPPTNSNRYRGLLSLIFKYAVAEGLCDNNPASHTINRKITKQRRRLKLEEYYAIRAIAEPWLKHAMDLALLTLQRREDILDMKFSDIKDGYLHVIQQKTEKHGAAAYIKIRIGNTLKDVINRCRDDIASPYIIHRLPDRLVKSKEKKHHTQLTGDYLTKGFAAARDKSGLFKNISIAERPSFHEIRSLGIKCYEDNGTDAQSLAGHSDRKMTDKYKEGHEIEWTIAEADLAL